MIGRKDKGDTVIAHEFDYEIEKQVGSLNMTASLHPDLSLHISVLLTRDSILS